MSLTRLQVQGTKTTVKNTQQPRNNKVHSQVETNNRFESLGEQSNKSHKQKQDSPSETITLADIVNPMKDFYW